MNIKLTMYFILLRHAGHHGHEAGVRDGIPAGIELECHPENGGKGLGLHLQAFLAEDMMAYSDSHLEYECRGDFHAIGVRLA